MPDATSFDRLRLVISSSDEPPAPDPHDPGYVPPDDHSAEPDVPSPHAEIDLAHQPYRLLGHDRGTFYFLSLAGGQVLEFNGRDLARDTVLMQLAPLQWWQDNYRSKAGADFKRAANEIIAASYKIGVYDPARLRGRGAWLDGDRSVLHLGDRLLVNGTIKDLDLPDSHYVYEHAIRLKLPIVDPLSATQARRLLDLCMMPTWDQPGHMGRLLAGWCVVAPVCGAMPWRPHLWVTGEKSSGKSWIMEQIISPVVGEIGFHVQSVTTEAGIRQDLGSDARPVIFDEAETQTEADRVRIQNVLNLARQASTEGGAAIVKGSSSGRATHYRIRSMFAFSSINLGITQAADESRIVSLSLRADTAAGAQDRFSALRTLHAELITADFAAQLLARTMTLLPVIRHNAGIFADAIASAGHGRRTGDTVGVLLAGAWSLRSSKRVTPGEADQFIAETDWIKQAITKADVQPEWQRALNHMLQHRLRVVRDHGSPEDIPIAELLDIVFRDSGAACSPSSADKALLRAGLRIMQAGKPAARFNGLYVWNNSIELASAFARSSWAAAWLSTLARTPGAYRATDPIRFGANGKQRSLCIPLAEIMRYDDDDG